MRITPDWECQLGLAVVCSFDFAPPLRRYRVERSRKDSVPVSMMRVLKVKRSTMAATSPLSGAALTATVPASGRSIGLVDYVTLVAGLLATVLLYGAANQLLSNGAAIGTWRNRHD